MRKVIETQHLAVPQISRPMVEDLVGKIHNGHFKPGARLPATSELAKQYHISYVSAAKALEQLAREGLIRRRPGQGTFVNDLAQAQRIRVIHFAAMGHTEMSNPIGRMIKALADQVQQADISVKLVSTSWQQDVQQVAARLVDRTRAAVVVTGQINADLLETLAKAAPTVVGIGLCYRDLPQVNLIDFDVDMTAYQATRRLQASGHERVFFLQSGIQAKPLGQLTAGYLGAMGHQALCQPSQPATGPIPREQITWILEHIIRGGRDAVVCANCNDAELLYRLGQERGLEVPRDFSIVTIGGNTATGLQFDTWEAPAEICGREAGQMILDNLRGLPPRHVTFGNHYVQGFSVKA